MDKKIFSFNLPNSLKKYLKNTSRESHMTITQYIVQLINDDKESKKGRFSKQLQNNPIANEDFLKQMNIKKFESGRKIKIGDYVLYGMLELPNKTTEKNRLIMKLITFHLDEFNNKYILSKFDNKTQDIPTLVKI